MTRVECVIDGCDWSVDITPPEVTEMTLASVFGIGVMAATAASQHAEQVERWLADHYGKHSLPSFLRTITRLRNELEAKDA